MPDDGSVAPPERINIVYKAATGDAQQEKELPLKMLVVGQFTNKQDATAVEDRKPIDINADNFNQVLKGMGLKLDVQVANKLDDKGGELPARVSFDSLKSFGPEAVAQQVPELARLLELRAALSALKGPMGNFPEFRKKIQGILGDAGARAKIEAELKA
ncbi:MAG: type VI secretion system contractile sheath small subunit [Planctomycetes bacterium]|nr:type VI secretion system contractile sheath small subunit [Planctomycetota bacterium]